MCYDIKTKLETQLKRAKHYNNQIWINELEETLRPYLDQDINHASGFSHPRVFIYTNKKPFEPQLYQWGLVPSWVKDENQKNQLWNKTINARGETINEKPSFKSAAQSRHCIIFIDGFFEHHHFNGKAYPFYIYRKDDAPMALAGIYDQWIEKSTGEIVNTFSIITTKANNLMKKIHNNPKLTEPRMPVILNKELEELWLNESSPTLMKNILRPFDMEEMTAHPVAPLRGKKYLGNVPEVTDEYFYENLKIAI